jgi:hypothetical protein
MKQQRRRSGILIGLVALGLLAGAALTARPAQAVDAAGPYYAEPAWDQKIGAATRFLVLTNWDSQAVLDKETGLVWERSPDVATLPTWSEARLTCTARTTGNHKGWRLPSVHELASLVHPAQVGPALPPGHPFLLTVQDPYWSATTDADNPASAWVVFFMNGNVGNFNKDLNRQVWCVRSGMNADAY